jgi:hypothetical protein
MFTTSQPFDFSKTPKVAFVAKAGDTYACIIDGKQIGKSTGETVIISSWC